jgi:hypothetical protein
MHKALGSIPIMSKIINIRNEREVIAIDIIDISGQIRNYYNQFYFKKCGR